MTTLALHLALAVAITTAAVVCVVDGLGGAGGAYNAYNDRFFDLIASFDDAQTRQHDNFSIPLPDLVTQYGYACETHKYVTEDGYINTLFRMPPRSGSGSRSAKTAAKAKHGHKFAKYSGPKKSNVVFLQHGLFSSAPDYVMGSPQKSLGYILADAGYDVWMGNARGNMYSRQHVNLTIKDTKYWQFSFDQMGKYDIPAALAYVLNTTGASKLSYIGHSMGTTMFWVAMNEHQAWMEQHVDLMIGMGPVATVEYIRSPIRILAPLASELEFLFSILGVKEFDPNNEVMEAFEYYACDETMTQKKVCANLAFLLMGFDEPQMNYTLLPIILGHSPSGASTQTVIHYAQGVNSGKFQKFDYGMMGNLLHYNSFHPPKYDLAKVTVPVVLMWGRNDWLADPEDVQFLVRGLNSTGYLLEDYPVPYPAFNHIDYLFALEADTLVYKRILKHLRYKDQMLTMP